MSDADRLRRPEERVVQVAAPVGQPAEAQSAEGGRPSIAVLPFANMSGDPEQEYFADGMVEEIITGLSRIRWLTVIARNSSFAYKGKSPDIRAVGRELNVRYVLEGSVRKGGNQLRITGQLIEAETGGHLWADKFDGALAHVFDLQDRITASVVGAIEPSVVKAEIERVKRKRTDNLDAYDLYLRALALAHEGTTERLSAAAAVVEQALALDPNFVQAHGLGAYIGRVLYQFRGSRPEDRDTALRHGQAVRALRGDDAVSLAHAALALITAGEPPDGCLAVFEQALLLNENSAAVHIDGAMVYASLQRWDQAREHAERALALSPLDPARFAAFGVLASAKMAAGDTEGALADARRAVQVNPNMVPGQLNLIACLVRLGRTEEAQSVKESFLMMYPDFRMGASAYLRWRTSIVADLRAAGLPE